MTAPAISIIIPAFNEAASIGNVVQQIRVLHPGAEIIVIDDGSSDHTAEAALLAGGKVYAHPYNIGNGAAIKSGLRAAQGEWVVMMDADGQHGERDDRLQGQGIRDERVASVGEA